MKNKNIWIVNYFTPPPQYVTQERHHKFYHYLKEKGYNVTIIASSYLVRNEINLINGANKYEFVKYDEYDFILIKSKSYTGNGISRMFSNFQFAYRLLKNRKKFPKPDLILHNLHVPFDCLVYNCAKKLKAKYIAEAWDLWPDSFVRFGLISEKNPIISFLYQLEKNIYKKADAVIFSMEGGLDYLKGRKWTKELGGPIDENKVHYINNGVDIADFNNHKKVYSLNDKDVENNSMFNVVYLGSIRLVNDVKQLIDAAQLLLEYKDIRFIIYGDGYERDFLIEYCNKNKIDNVIFKDKFIPLTHVPYVMSRASVNILNYKKDFGLYGISSGKLFQSLASGKPLICNIELNYDLITKYNLGIAEELDTPKKYADAVLKIYNMDIKEYNEMCERVLNQSYQFDYKFLSDKLIDIIENI